MEGPDENPQPQAVSFQDLMEMLTRTNYSDERGLCGCPEWDATRNCSKLSKEPQSDPDDNTAERLSCWLFHQSRDCIPFVLHGTVQEKGGCSLGAFCPREHSQLVHDYHQSQRPCRYSDEDAQLLRQCNSEVDELLKRVCIRKDCPVKPKPKPIDSDKGKEEEEGDGSEAETFHLHHLFDEPELEQFLEPLVILDLTRQRDQIQVVSRFLLKCGKRWREKIQLLELFFRANGFNTWLSCQTHIEQGTVESPDGKDYLHIPLAALRTVCWDYPHTGTPYKLNISTRPKLESVKKMLEFNESYSQNFARLTQAGMLIQGEGPQPSPSQLDELERLKRQVEEQQSQLNQKDREIEEAKDSQICAVCMSDKKNAKFIPCKHVTCCKKCAKRVDNCPICRAEITGYEEVYM